MQGVINDLQRELARLRPVQPVEPTISDDESMALVPAPQSASVLMSELIGRGPREASSGCRREWDRREIAGRSPRVHARNGLKGQSCRQAIQVHGDTVLSRPSLRRGSGILTTVRQFDSVPDEEPQSSRQRLVRLRTKRQRL